VTPRPSQPINKIKKEFERQRIIIETTNKAIEKIKYPKKGPLFI